MINHPSNAFNAESNAHESYDKLAWGIEAVEADGQVKIISEQCSRELTPSQWKYYFREIRPAEISPTIKQRWTGDYIWTWRPQWSSSRQTQS